MFLYSTIKGVAIALNNGMCLCREKIEFKRDVTIRSYHDDSNQRKCILIILLNSIFGFCTGGSGVGSYRVGEVLQARGVFIIVPGTIPALQPEIN